MWIQLRTRHVKQKSRMKGEKRFTREGCDLTKRCHSIVSENRVLTKPYHWHHYRLSIPSLISTDDSIIPVPEAIVRIVIDDAFFVQLIDAASDPVLAVPVCCGAARVLQHECLCSGNIALFDRPNGVAGLYIHRWGISRRATLPDLKSSPGAAVNSVIIDNINGVRCWSQLERPMPASRVLGCSSNTCDS